MGCRGHFGPQAEISGWNTVNSFGLQTVINTKKPTKWAGKIWWKNAFANAYLAQKFKNIFISTYFHFK